MRLETAAFMTHAHTLCTAHGFRACMPYRVVAPEFAATTIWMERPLDG